MKHSPPIIFLCLLIFFVSATSAARAGDEEAVKAVITANAKAMQEMNLKAYMDTIDPSSPNYGQNETAMSNLFELCRQKQYSFKYDITSMEVLEIKDGVAKVKFCQATTKVNGPDDFRNNMLTGTHTLKKVGGRWKLAETKVLDVKYL